MVAGLWQGQSRATLGKALNATARRGDKTLRMKTQGNGTAANDTAENC